MTIPSGQAAPGWYPDPSGEHGQRWWDGRVWTEHVTPTASGSAASGSAGAASGDSAPRYYAIPERRAIAADAPVYGIWIWLVTFLPLVPVGMLFLLQPTVVVRVQAPGTNLAVLDPIALLGGPMFFVDLAVSWILWAAIIVFSWLDHRDLLRIGVERPFHWAWSFVGSIVYVIGRSIIVRKVAAGRGFAPVWWSIAVFALSIVLPLIWALMLVTTMFQSANQVAPIGA